MDYTELADEIAGRTGWHLYLVDKYYLAWFKHPKYKDEVCLPIALYVAIYKDRIADAMVDWLIRWESAQVSIEQFG